MTEQPDAVPPRATNARSGQDFDSNRLTSRVTAPPELEDDANRERWGLGRKPTDRGPHIVELNVLHVKGLASAATGFLELFESTFSERVAWDQPGRPPTPVKISKAYFRCELSVREWKQMIAADEGQADRQATEDTGDEGSEIFAQTSYRMIYKLWPDFPIRPHITKSIATIKADAALRSFDASGEGITWAVIDSGVLAEHPHFGRGERNRLTNRDVRSLHRCFAPIDNKYLADPDEPNLEMAEVERRLAEHLEFALQDDLGHGTHVAGIITGSVAMGSDPVVLESRERIEPSDGQENNPQRQTVTTQRVVRDEREKARFHGVAPDCRIVSLRALEADGSGRSSNLVRALEYIREHLNDNPKFLRVHGVNLSVGYEFDAEMFACGQSPLCTEVNRLVQSGVVVVTAAGNTGYTTLTANNRVTKVGLSSTINDPGNADLAITVGSTHRESPHTFGISYFSSKGPTGDGRLKPDLVAPGERIISCAAGEKQRRAMAQREDDKPTARPTDSTSDIAYYVEDSGTSMAAPHVSGAIAAFLSIRREFIGRPHEVKKIFTRSAIALGRERYFEGSGLVDLMKAIQSV